MPKQPTGEEGGERRQCGTQRLLCTAAAGLHRREVHPQRLRESCGGLSNIQHTFLMLVHAQAVGSVLFVRGAAL